MEEKRFFDVFKKYDPQPEKRALLERATSAVFKYQKAPMRVEVELSFPSHENALLLYEIEDECMRLYGAESFKIIPHFPPEEWDISRFDEIAFEAAQCGAITHGFLNNASYSDDGEVVHISIPFFSRGVDFVTSAGTQTILENIMKSRYGIHRRVQIVGGEGAREFEEQMEQRRSERLRRVEEENLVRAREERAARAKAAEEVARAKDPHYDFDAKVGLSSLAGQNSVISDTNYRMGASLYNTEGASVIFGEEFDIVNPTPLSELENSKGSSIYLGTVFEVTTKETRGGD